MLNDRQVESSSWEYVHLVYMCFVDVEKKYDLSQLSVMQLG